MITAAFSDGASFGEANSGFGGWQERDEPQPDLAHTLRRWQEGGIAIELQRTDIAGPVRTIEVRRPSGFGRIWQRALTFFGLRPHALGGFGGIIPVPSSG